MKILVSGADDIGLYFRFMFLSICFVRFFVSFRLILLFLWCLIYYK